MSTTVAPPADATSAGGAPPPPPSSLESSPYARVLGAVEELPWLETLGEKLDSLLTPLTSRRGLMDVLHGRWLGHALHPAVSDVPIGFWAAVPILDAVGEEVGAATLAAAGCAASVVTAASGAADWSVTYGRDKRLGLFHGLVNTAALTLQLGSLAARAAGARGAGRVLSLSALGVASAGAYLGGELVFGRGEMVNHTFWTHGPTDWTPVLDDTALREGTTHAVDVQGRKVLISRVEGRVCAMEDACSHAGGPLSEGTVEDGVVTCPWHGSRFRLRDGSVVGSPATFPQPRLECRVAGGRIEVRGRE